MKVSGGQRLLGVLRQNARTLVRAYVRGPAPQKGKGRLMTVARHLSQRGDPEELVEIEPGLRMQLDLSSHIERLLYYQGFYHRAVMEHFLAQLAPGQVLVDVGANIGEFSLRAAKRLGSNGRILACEPASDCLSRIGHNLALNGFTNIEVHKVALSDAEGEMTLHLNASGDSNRGQSSLTRLAHHAESERVRVTTLDQLVHDQGLARLDVVKIDTQGAELRVLSGATRSIKTFRPAAIVRCRESHSRAFGDSMLGVQQFFRDHDYDVFRIEVDGTLQPLAEPTLSEDSTFLAKPRRGR